METRRPRKKIKRDVVATGAVLLSGFFVILVVVRAIGLLDQRGVEPQAEVTPHDINIGSVHVDEAVSRTLTLRNKGNSRLLLLDVKASCQCAVLDPGRRVVAPGESAHLVVVFKATSAGTKRPQIAIRTNDPETPVLVVTLEANVVTESGQQLSTRSGRPGQDP